MKLRTIIATATTAAVLATSGVALAGAATGSGSPSPSDHAAASTGAAESRTHPVLQHRARVHIRRARRRAAAVIVKTIGIDRSTFRDELRSGKTIAEIATAHNVQPQTVIDALVTAVDKRVDRAVDNGRISTDRAAKIKERLATRITRVVNEWHLGQFRNRADA